MQCVCVYIRPIGDGAELRVTHAQYLWRVTDSVDSCISHGSKRARAIRVLISLAVIPLFVKRNLGQEDTNRMSDKEDEGSEAAKAGISAKVLDELEERLVEKIMRRMAPREGEGSSGRSTGG